MTTIRKVLTLTDIIEHHACSIILKQIGKALHTLHCPFAHTNCYYHSFVPSSVRAWNSLEEQQVCAGSLSSFNKSLLPHLPKHVSSLTLHC